MRLPYIFALLIATLSCAPSMAANCTASEVQIDSLKAVHGTSVTRVIGRMINRCSSPTGAQIKFIFYGSDGTLLRVQDAWPASTNNVPARSDFPFEFSVPKVDGLERIDARVIQVREW